MTTVLLPTSYAFGSDSGFRHGTDLWIAYYLNLVRHNSRAAVVRPMHDHLSVSTLMIKMHDNRILRRSDVSVSIILFVKCFCIHNKQNSKFVGSQNFLM